MRRRCRSVSAADTIGPVTLTIAFVCATFAFVTSGDGPGLDWGAYLSELFEAVCAAAAGIALLVLWGGERAALRVDATADSAPAGLEVAREIAHQARAGAILLALASLGAGAALVAVGVSPWSLGLPLVALSHAIAVGLRAHRILGARDFGALTATTDRRRIFLSRGDHLASWLHTTPAQLARARDRTLPAAVAYVHAR
ncbi:MAG: hypothetical protein KIT31_01765 [Deltaproteobacteria bacterium]|nr:hypothetical protein [Deltaproteobacteria bacterium]